MADYTNIHIEKLIKHFIYKLLKNMIKTLKREKNITKV